LKELRRSVQLQGVSVSEYHDSLPFSPSPMMFCLSAVGQCLGSIVHLQRILSVVERNVSAMVNLIVFLAIFDE
jgi:hypothetical protein